MAKDGSISHWLNELHDDVPDRAQMEIWNRYFERLVSLARTKLAGVPRKAKDEEDVAIAAMHSFFRRTSAGQFPQITNRNNLWAILATITVRKAINLRAEAGRQKRGGGKLVDSAALPDVTFAELARSPEPTPSEAAAFAEECRRLLELLPAELQRVALRKLEGYSNAEIAADIQKVSRTVERKLELIREIWRNVGEDSV